MLPLPSPLGLSDMGPGVWLQMTDQKHIVVAALSMVGPQAGPHKAWVGVGLDEVHRLRERIERGDLLLVGREQLEWVRLWVLHGEVEQPCPTCGILMPVNPDCGWICGNRDCHQPGQPFGIQPYEILNLILGPSPEPNGVKP
jgi:hypothetical protein